MKGKEKVKSPILSKKRSDLHEKYISCGQYINWNLEGLSILESEHAFIVQEVRIEVAPLNQYVEAAHYFEAWEVKDGKVMGVKDADCDDMFRIGDDFDEDDLIRDSMGKFGTVLFIPKVYVVKSNSELYDCVNSWPLNGVKQSNGLKSCKANTKLEEAFKNVPAFERDIFRHDWKFDDPEDIYAVVLRYCQNKKYSAQDIDRLFANERYEDVKTRVKNSMSMIMKGASGNDHQM